MKAIDNSLSFEINRDSTLPVVLMAHNSTRAALQTLSTAIWDPLRPPNYMEFHSFRLLSSHKSITQFNMKGTTLIKIREYNTANARDSSHNIHNTIQIIAILNVDEKNDGISSITAL
jgi:hypothetical protein